MDQRRLDQLKFPDETKIGLALVITYMIADVTQSITFGGAHLILWFGSQSTAKLGLFQLLLLIALTAGLMLWRRHRSMSLLGLCDLDRTDKSLAAAAKDIALRVGRSHPRFLVTSNLQDANAFCLADGRAPCVVLGGGLRLLHRRQPERVHALIAHECSHVASHDVAYVIVAWHIFCAYAFLLLANLALAQARFWAGVPEVMPAYQEVGTEIVWLLQVNAPHIFGAGFSGVVSLVGVWVIIRYFFALREYRADERAAQTGLRGPLADLVVSARVARGFSLRGLFRTHPNAQSRFDRLTSEKPWARFDCAFLAGVAFIVTRLSDLLPSFGSVTISDTPSDFEEMFAIVGSTLASQPLLAVEIASDVVFVLLVALHVYPVAVTQKRNGAKLLFSLSFMLPTVMAVFAGAFIGELSSWGQMARLADKTVPWTLPQAIELAAFDAVLMMELYALLMAALVMVAPRFLPKQPRRPSAQLARLLFACLATAFLLQVIVGSIGVGVWHVTGGMDPWVVEWLPALSRQPLQGGPSPLQSAVILLLVMFVLAAARFLALELGRRPTVHDGWYAKA